MKKILKLLIGIAFLCWATSSFAWQNPCFLQDYDFIMSGDYVLTNFTDEAQFGPAPDCGGHVTILCPDDRECVLPYDVWGEDLIIGKDNNHAMDFKLTGDTRLVQQNDAEAEWEDILAQNGCPGTQSAGLCGPNHLSLCENQTACKVVGGHWYNDACNAQTQAPECPSCPDCPACNCTITECPSCPDCNCTECSDCTPAEEEPFACPLVGNVYRYELPDMSAELSNFRCEVGPGCTGTCDLWYGDFDSGPLSKVELPFSCTKNGILISRLPCAVNSNGNLKCLGAVVDNYHYYQIGTVTYCFPEKKEVFQFSIE